jgi:hypothetical protein
MGRKTSSRKTVFEYNAIVNKSDHLPDADHLSVLAAMILLAYALARFINIPARELAIQLPGIYLAVQLNVQTIVVFLVAGLTAAGADWLLRQHPAVSGQSTLEHLLVPALTAWVIGIPLFQMPLGPLWWAGFAFGGAALMLVLVAEYIVIDPDDRRQPAAAAGLTAVSFALYLTLAIALRFSGTRLYLVLPALGLAAWLVSLRTLHLRLHGRWTPLQSGGIALLCAQFAAGLYYWPISPVAFGLVVSGSAYAITSLVANLTENEPLQRALIEPALVLAIVCVTAIWLH